jgi:hypothetical protein
LWAAAPEGVKLQDLRSIPLIKTFSWVNSCYILRRPPSLFGLWFTHVLASEVVLSPILVRPVREQLEHDRVIRLLQAKYKRKFEVAINPGNEQSSPVGASDAPWYPDLVLQTADKNRKLAGVVEVESAESVNHLEAMSQWKAFGGLRVPFHLYLPTASIDSARRFCTDMDIPVAELWAYQSVGDQIRFTLIQRTGPAEDGKGSRSSVEPAASEPRPRVAAEPRPRASAEPRPRAAAEPRPRAAATPARAASTARPPAQRTRSNGQVTRRPAARRPAAPVRPVASKPKAAAARRPAAKPVARKAKAASNSSRPQKRR